MKRTQIYLTDDERRKLNALAAVTGKAQSQLIREAVDGFLEEDGATRRKAVLNRAAGLWKDRHDLPDFIALRRQWDRGFGA